MKAKALIPIMLALILGVMTFVIGKRVLNKQAVAAPQGGARVLVASAALPPGHTLTAADVKFMSAPVEQISATMFRDSKNLEGRVLSTGVEPGQILRQSLLAPEGTSSALQAKVPHGMRAVTISVNEFSGLAGLISPGVRVDLVATLVDNVSGETFAKTIVQNVTVSAVGQELEAGVLPKNDPRAAGPRAHKTVTLLVTPTQAAAIDLAFSKSKPRLVLRSSDDDTPVLDQGVTMAELSGRADEDRLAVTAKGETTDELKEILAAMQKQLTDATQASRDAARQAAQEIVGQNGVAEQPAEQGHSVRVFRGGAESREQFDADGRAAGAPARPQQAPAQPKRETEQVKAPASDGEARTAAE